MKFKITRDVENRILSTKIEFVEFGNESTTPERELEMFKDFGFPKVEVGGQFEADGDTFVAPAKEVEVNKGFVATYSVSLDKVAGATNKDKMEKAIARTEAFETAIQSRIEAEIEKIKSELGEAFVENNPSTFEV